MAAGAREGDAAAQDAGAVRPNPSANANANPNPNANANPNPNPNPNPYLMQVLSDPKEWRNRLVNTKSHMAKVSALTTET